jgi:glycosyltransferase involved in cell wall biosynthesis
MMYVIFGDAFTFPEGDASTNRVYAYAKGFNENGINVHIICFRNDYLENPNGETSHIKYSNPYGLTNRSGSFIIRRWQNINKHIKTFRLIRDINKKEKIVIFLCYTKVLKTQLFCFALSRFCGSKLVLERSEHPLKDLKNNIAGRISGKFKVAMEIKYCDAIFCISDYLVRFYNTRGADIRKLLKVPSTVDSNRFNNNFISPVNFKYICYCGSLTILKDGVDILIQSFAKIASVFENINLLLVGKADTIEDEVYFRNLVSVLDLNHRITFTGKLPRNAIPAYLCNAEILAMARPRSIVADAGFPSKLTEYLSTGKPVVATKVGEIPEYLTDNENIFLAEPGSVKAFAERMEYVLTNYHIALTAGMKGKELASTIFNYHYQAQMILSFVDAL